MRRKRKGQGHTPWNRRRRRSFLVLALIVAVAGPALAWRVHLRSELNQRVNEMRSQGRPLNLAELAEWEPHDPREAEADAAFAAVFSNYHEMEWEAFQHLPRFQASEQRLLELPFSAETRGVLEARLVNNESTLRALLDASRFPRYRIGRDYLNRGYFQVESDLKRPMEVLCAAVCLRAEAGDAAGAMEALLAGMRIARACRATPCTAALNSSVVCEQMVLSVLPAAALRVPLPREGLEAFETLHADRNWTEDVIYAVTGDRCIEFQYLGFGRGAWGQIRSILGYTDLERIQSLEFYRHVPDLASLTFEDRAAYLRDHGMQWALRSAWTLSASTIYPVHFAAVFQYYQKYRRFPDSLEALVPEFVASGDQNELGKVRYVREGNSVAMGSTRWTIVNPEGEGGAV